MSSGLQNYKYLLSDFKTFIPYLNIDVDMTGNNPAKLGFGSTLIYCILIFVVFPFFTPKDEAGKTKLEKIAKVHFTLLFLYSAFAFLSTFIYITQSGEILDFNRYMCDPVPTWLRFVSVTFTISKIWEWGDTAIDICRGKSLSKIGFLHCYHHATTFLLFLLVMNFPGTEKSGMLLNGFVHTLMYYHYGFRLPSFMRPFITGSQIIQLITVTYFWHITPTECANFGNFPKDNRIEFLLPYTLVPVYTIFFIKFFMEQYIFPKPKKDSNKTK